MFQILVSKLTTIHTCNDWGRYVEVVPMSDILGDHSIGAEMEFFSRDGRSVLGVVVDMSKEMKCGKFPAVNGIVIDTNPTAKHVVKHKSLGVPSNKNSLAKTHLSHNVASQDLICNTDKNK